MSGFFAQPSTNECLSSCPTSYFANAATRTCDQCDTSCSTCITSATNCQACKTQYYPTSASLPGTCSQCDAACDECTGAGNTACQACDSAYYPVDLHPTTCLNACTDFAANYFLDSGVCKECASECATCSGLLNQNCISCASSHYEIVGSATANPMHCLSSCPPFYYDDAWQCKDCLANCEVCSDSVSCITCGTGYFYLGTACLPSCPA